MGEFHELLNYRAGELLEKDIESKDVRLVLDLMGQKQTFPDLATYVYLKPKTIDITSNGRPITAKDVVTDNLLQQFPKYTRFGVAWKLLSSGKFRFHFLLAGEDGPARSTGSSGMRVQPELPGSENMSNRDVVKQRVINEVGKRDAILAGRPANLEGVTTHTEINALEKAAEEKIKQNVYKNKALNDLLEPNRARWHKRRRVMQKLIDAGASFTSLMVDTKLLEYWNPQLLNV